jgi:hypothetical protein
MKKLLFLFAIAAVAHVAYHTWAASQVDAVSWDLD